MILQNNGLYAFMAVVEAGTVHSAAKKLGLTQTAVTQRLKSLETDLQLTLFLRSRRGMTLTADGAALLQYCKSASELEGAFLSRVSGEARKEVQVTIVGHTSAISTRVVADCEPLYAKFPHLRLQLRADDHSDRIDLLRKGEADLAIVPSADIPNEMDSKLLKADRYLLVASSRWKGRRLSEILENERIIDFYEQDHTTATYLKKFNLYGEVKKERLFVNNNQALIQLLASGIGFATLAESVAREPLTSGSLIALNRAQAIEEEIALAWYPRTQKPDYFSAILQAIK